jgi:hypothetical protein
MSFAKAEESLHEQSLKLNPQNGPRQKFTISYATGPEDFVCYLNGEFQNARTFVVPAEVARTLLSIVDASGGPNAKGDTSEVRLLDLARRNADLTVNLNDIRSGKVPDVAVPQRAMVVIPSIEDTRKLKPGESFTLTPPPPLNYTDAPATALPKDGMKLTVNADGKLIDPAFGTVGVEGRQLRDIRKELIDRIEMRRKVGAGMSDAAFNALWDDWKKEQRQKAEKPKSE